MEVGLAATVDTHAIIVHAILSRNAALRQRTFALE
jgi:hypothetical protein